MGNHLPGQEAELEGGRMTRFRMLNWWISQKLDNLHIILALIGVLICLTGIISGETEFCRYGSAGLTVLGVVGPYFCVF